MSSQSPYQTPGSPHWQNQLQVYTSPGSDQHSPYQPVVENPQPGYPFQQLYPPMSSQPVVSASPYHFCPRCGSQLTPNTTICSTCGSSIPGPSLPAPMQPTALPYQGSPSTEGSAAKAQMAINVQPSNLKRDRRRWITAWVVMYVIGVLGTVVAFLSLSNTQSLVVPTITLGESLLFLLLATFVAVRKSQAALHTGIAIYTLDALLALIGGLIGAVVMHALLLSVLIVGAGATKRLAEQARAVTQPQFQPEFPMQQTEHELAQ